MTRDRMEELVRWLGVQLDEDAVEAQEALKRTTTTRRRIGGKWVEDTVQPPEWRRSVWDPARVLREVEAKRRLVALHTRSHHQCVTEDGPTQWHAADPCTTLRLLALPYADRPGYRNEWRP